MHQVSKCMQSGVLMNAASGLHCIRVHGLACKATNVLPGAPISSLTCTCSSIWPLLPANALDPSRCWDVPGISWVFKSVLACGMPPAHGLHASLLIVGCWFLCVMNVRGIHLVCIYNRCPGHDVPLHTQVLAVWAACSLDRVTLQPFPDTVYGWQGAAHQAMNLAGRRLCIGLLGSTMSEWTFHS